MSTIPELWSIPSANYEKRPCFSSCQTFFCELEKGVLPTNDAHRTRKIIHPARLSDSSSLVASLRDCARCKDLRRGIALHDEILQRGFLGKCSDALVTMYAKCGALTKAQVLLDTQKSKNVFAWTAVISGHVQMGQGKAALECFDQMRQEGISPDIVAITSVLQACGLAKALEKGMEIHDEIARQGLLADDLVLGNALVDMYAKCGALAQAKGVFEELHSRDVVSWNALIAGYAQQEQSEQALETFDCMQRAGISPDAVTYVCVLKACGTLGASERGKQIHEKIAAQRLLAKNVVLGTALVSMYAKCGDLGNAKLVFEKLPARDVISWSTLIIGYAQQGHAERALDCYEQMRIEGLSPDGVTFACILKACGNLRDVDRGARVHDEIARRGLLKKDVVLGNALVDMYVKCGALLNARQVLNELPLRDTVTYNSLFSGYAQQGKGKQLLHCFHQMQSDTPPPNSTTFGFVLNACTQLRLVEDASMYFECMKTKYGIQPNLEHYRTMVNLLGSAGHIDRAVGIMKGMLAYDPPCTSGCLLETARCKCWSAVWFALLKACHKWGDVTVGEWAFKQVMQGGRGDVAAYKLMANIYADACVEDVVREERIESFGVKRTKPM